MSFTVLPQSCIIKKSKSCLRLKANSPHCKAKKKPPTSKTRWRDRPLHAFLTMTFQGQSPSVLSPPPQHCSWVKDLPSQCHQLMIWAFNHCMSLGAKSYPNHSSIYLRQFSVRSPRAAPAHCASLGHNLFAEFSIQILVITSSPRAKTGRG